MSDFPEIKRCTLLKDENIKYATADEFLRIEGAKWICYENGERETQTRPTTTDILRE